MSKPAREFRTEIWLQDKQIRNDVRLRYKESDPYHREILCVNCEKEGYYIQHSEQDPAEFGQLGAKLALSMRKIPANPQERGIIEHVNPRMLGMVANPSQVPSQLYHLESFVGQADRQKLTTERVQLQNQECWLLAFENAIGSKIRLWIAPNMGPSVVRIECGSRNPGDGKYYQDVMDSTLRKHTPSELWFPLQCVYQRTVDGKLVEKVVDDITIHSLNQPLPPETFLLSGFGLAKDTPISLADSPVGRTWDGEKLVPRKREPLQEVDDFPEANPRRPYLLAGAISFAFLAGIALCWFFFGKKATPRRTP